MTPARHLSTRSLIVIGLALSAVLAGVLSFYASSHPDGLEFVARTLGFEHTAADHATGSFPVADYAVQGVDNARLSGGLAGLIGIVLVGLVMFALARLLRRRSNDA